MDFELSLEPDTAARLTRSPLLARNRAGQTGQQRPRPQRQCILWHDSPDRQLAAAGLALAEERGTWRLERLYPGIEDWPPGAPAPALAQAADPSLLGVTLPAALGPVAAYEGVVTDHPIDTEHGSVALRRMRGGLRTVAAERVVARLIVSGSEPAVLAVLHQLSGAMVVTVPRASLAAEALAAADGRPPPARRLAAPRLPGDVSIGDAFGHALGHLTDVILYHAPAASAGTAGPEPVHQMRVAVRRLRSAIAVFRSAIASDVVNAADAGLRDLARQLGPARDWDVFVTETAPTITAALPADMRLQRLIGASERRRSDCHTALRDYLEGAGFRRLGIDLAWLAAARTWHRDLPPDEQAALGQALSGFAAHVLQRRLRKLRAAGEDIEALEVPALHGLRLRAKRMRYAAEILAPLFPGKAARRFIDRLSRLQGRLGHLNDTAVAVQLMGELGGPVGRHGYAVGLVTGFTGAGSLKLRPGIIRSWEKFLRQPGFWA